MTQKEEQRQLVDAYLEGKVGRRSFMRRLVKTGVSVGAAATYATVLAQQARADTSDVKHLLDEGKKDILQGKRKLIDGKADIVAGHISQGKREILEGKELIAEGLADLAELYAGL